MPPELLIYSMDLIIEPQIQYSIAQWTFSLKLKTNAQIQCVQNGIHYCAEESYLT